MCDFNTGCPGQPDNDGFFHPCETDCTGITMKIFICNAFSLSMLDRNVQRRSPFDPLFRPRIPHPEIDPIDFLKLWEENGAEIVSAVGHESTANIFSAVLDRPIPANRTSVKLDDDSMALIGQHVGPRLPEGATTLPEGAAIEWWAIEWWVV